MEGNEVGPTRGARGSPWIAVLVGLVLGVLALAGWWAIPRAPLESPPAAAPSRPDLPD